VSVPIDMSFCVSLLPGELVGLSFFGRPFDFVGVPVPPF
jgi:hypothetical protein